MQASLKGDHESVHMNLLNQVGRQNVPLPHAHDEGVDIFVQSVQKADHLVECKIRSGLSLSTVREK